MGGEPVSTNREDLHRLADELPDDVAGKVVRFARAELAKAIATDAGSTRSPSRWPGA